jgi:hypothetical protein
LSRGTAVAMQSGAGPCVRGETRDEGGVDPSCADFGSPIQSLGARAPQVEPGDAACGRLAGGSAARAPIRTEERFREVRRRAHREAHSRASRFVNDYVGRAA